MKKLFKVYRVVETEVCTPSTDYYRGGGDWSEETITTLQFQDQFESEEDALKYLSELSGEFTILTTYVIS